MHAAHPTREAWEERQRRLPPAAVAIREAAARDRAEREAARGENARILETATRRHRAGFESHLATVLAAVGGDWLTPYRLADSLAGEKVFQVYTRQFLAVFDPAEIGLNRIAVELVHGPNGWQLSDCRPWYVIRPTGTLDASTFPLAVDLAAEYVSTPF